MYTAYTSCLLQALTRGMYITRCLLLLTELSMNNVNVVCASDITGLWNWHDTDTDNEDGTCGCTFMDVQQ